MFDLEQLKHEWYEFLNYLTTVSCIYENYRIINGEQRENGSVEVDNYKM